MFSETHATPTRTRITPRACCIVNGSLITKTASMMVKTGPAAPKIDVREAPILEIASVIIKLGRTVHTNASNKA